jgi:hypothetical protein
VDYFDDDGFSRDLKKKKTKIYIEEYIPSVNKIDLSCKTQQTFAVSNNL